jgi:hypothetical protein
MTTRTGHLDSRALVLVVVRRHEAFPLFSTQSVIPLPLSGLPKF